MGISIALVSLPVKMHNRFLLTNHVHSICMRTCLSLILLCCTALLLSACASAPQAPVPQQLAPAPKHSGNLTDFSGHWEKNYKRSDDFDNRFNLYVANVKRLYAQESRDGNGNKNAIVGTTAAGVNGLAQFSEELTRMPTLTITQDNQGINVERENDFNLRCQYKDKLYVQSSNAFGNELCGWNRDRIVFQMRLAGGLQISHLFSLSPDGTELNVTTTINSDAVAIPVVISNYYTRFSSPEDRYDCQQTLTRNKVCTQLGHGK